MIKYNPKSWISLIFDFYSWHVAKTLLPMIAFIGLFTTFFCFIVKDVLRYHYSGTIMLHSILGIILGLFLVFRTNTAYDRWWEGRKLWGQLVNDARMLAIKINTFLPDDDSENREFFRVMIPNLTFAMKEHLRDSIKVGEMEFLDDESKNAIIQSKHRPNTITDLIYHRILKLKNEGKITNEELIILDKELKGFIDIIGGCERIKSTPIPYSYSMFIKKFLFVYSITLPASFVWEFGYWSVPIVMIFFYFLVSIELISEEIEDPFGDDINDLPLNLLCQKIQINVLDVLHK